MRVQFSLIPKDDLKSPCLPDVPCPVALSYSIFFPFNLSGLALMEILATREKKVSQRHAEHPQLSLPAGWRPGNGPSRFLPSLALAVHMQEDPADSQPGDFRLPQCLSVERC